MKEEEHIQRGFNAGYQLQKHDPELAAQIAQGTVDSQHPFTEAFNAGREQWQNEQDLSKASEQQNYYDSIRHPNSPAKNEKSKSRDKGIDL